MNKIMKSLKMQSLLALLLSVIISVGFFFVIDNMGTYLLDNYFKKSSYLAETHEKCLDRFEHFVDKYKIKTSDEQKIKSWLKDEKAGYVAIAIVDNNKTIFDSLGNMGEYSIGFYKSGINRKINFADKSATVYLKGYFDYQFYVNTTIVEVVIAVAIFIGIFIVFIQRKIDYIVKLEKEVKILETGGLDYEITIKDRDEIASLAFEIDQMRTTLLENIKNEEKAVKAN